MKLHPYNVSWENRFLDSLSGGLECNRNHEHQQHQGTLGLKYTLAALAKHKAVQDNSVRGWL